MAIVFPKKRLEEAEVLDIDDINSAFRGSAQESSSLLGEHNWIEGAFTAADLDPTQAVVVTTSYHESDNSTSEGVAVPATSHIVNGERSWEEVPNMSITVTTGNSVMWVMASLQYSSYKSTTGLESEIAFCLARNGAPIPETITGTADTANDPACLGVVAARSPVVLDTIVPVAPGSQRFTVLVRSRKNFQFPWIGLDFNDTVDNRELIVLEMK